MEVAVELATAGIAFSWPLLAIVRPKTRGLLRPAIAQRRFGRARDRRGYFDAFRSKNPTAAPQADIWIQATVVRLSRVSTLGELTTSIAREVKPTLTGIVARASNCRNGLGRDPTSPRQSRQSRAYLPMRRVLAASLIGCAICPNAALVEAHLAGCEPVTGVGGLVLSRLFSAQERQLAAQAFPTPTEHEIAAALKVALSAGPQTKGIWRSL